MWKYIRQYLLPAVLAGLFMIGEVLMDPVQPSIMSRIVDDGVLGVNNGGVSKFVSLFVRGLIRTSLLTFGSMYFMFRLNLRFGLIVLCAFPSRHLAIVWGADAGQPGDSTPIPFPGTAAVGMMDMKKTFMSNCGEL